MLDTTNIPEEIISEIKSYIDEALLKRGLPTVEITQDKNPSYPLLILKSESFNTYPVIMKSFMIKNFGGSLKLSTEKYILEDEEGIDIILEREFIRIWIPVSVSYEHFDLGGNGASLFDYTANLYYDSKNNKYLLRKQHISN